MICQFRTGLIALAVCLLPLASAGAQDWKALFDGRSLEGFHQLGGKADYKTEDGTIVGTTRPGEPNSFLCTDRYYGDFYLEYEFKVDPQLNSGVQIRSNSLPEYRNGRVHGYQVEIDPDPERARFWTAGVYDEARRGWLNTLEDNKPARDAFKPGKWNHIRVEAVGDSIKTWLNGVPAADLRDSMTFTGFIGLQVHGIGNRQDGPFKVAWRKLAIKDLGRHDWEPIFDGQSLSGWQVTSDAGKWEVRDGVLVGTSAASERDHTILLSDATYDDFTLRLSYKAVEGNSGLYFRSEPVDGPTGVKGFQAEIDTGGAYAGGLYETAGRAWVAQPDPEVVKKAFRPSQWNQMTVSAHGDRIVIHLNDIKTVDIVDPQGAKSGRIGLQLHGGQKMHMEIRSIELLKKQ